MSMSHNFVRELWFIRHGESQANAGFATSDPATISLTDLGRRQAQTVSQLIGSQPDLIITSPYTRTQQTAAPTLKQFSATPHQTWPVQEFTYLSPDRCINTIRQDRKEFVNEYWARSEPDFIAFFLDAPWAIHILRWNGYSKGFVSQAGSVVNLLRFID